MFFVGDDLYFVFVIVNFGYVFLYEIVEQILLIGNVVFWVIKWLVDEGVIFEVIKVGDVVIVLCRDVNVIKYVSVSLGVSLELVFVMLNVVCVDVVGLFVVILVQFKFLMWCFVCDVGQLKGIQVYVENIFLGFGELNFVDVFVVGFVVFDDEVFIV